MLESTGRREELIPVDVRVAGNCGEVGVAEVLRHKSGIAGILTEPGRCRVAEGVSGHVLVESRARRGAPDDVGEDRLLEASAGEPAEDPVGRVGLSRVADVSELSSETSRHRLAARLSALAAADEERTLPPVEVEIAPLEGAELGAA